MRLAFALLLIPAGVSLWPLFAAAPVPVADVAPMADLNFEVESRIGELETLLANEESFAAAKDGEVRRAFGVLACVGQAIAEHSDAQSSKIAGPTMRDAARQFSPKSTLDEARSALTAVKAAAAGQADGQAVVEHEWNRLINMHPMMEEIEARSGKLVRVARRPRGTPEETAHASTIAVLTLAMIADTHEVKDPAQIPEWDSMAREYQKLMTELATAIREKDRKSAGDMLVKATQSCDRCHEKFRD